MASKIKSSGTQLLNIPNSPEGEQFLRQFRSYLNKPYKVSCRGRGTRKNGKGKQSHISLSRAEWWALYINGIVHVEKLWAAERKILNQRTAIADQMDTLELLRKDNSELIERNISLGQELEISESKYEELANMYFNLPYIRFRRWMKSILWYIRNYGIKITYGRV